MKKINKILVFYQKNEKKPVFSLRIKYLLTQIHEIDAKFLQNNWQGLYELLSAEFSQISDEFKSFIRRKKLEIEEILLFFSEKIRKKQEEIDDFSNEIARKNISKFVEIADVRVCLTREISQNDQKIKIKRLSQCFHRENSCFIKENTENMKENSKENIVEKIKENYKENTKENMKENLIKSGKSSFDEDPNHCFTIEKSFIFLGNCEEFD